MAKPSSLASRLEKVPVKFNKWNSQEVRVGLDDLVAKYFVEEAHYRESNVLLHYKLLFVSSLTVIGGMTSLYAYLTPFAKAKLLVGLGAATYMTLLGFYTLWLSYMIIPTCFRGTAPSSRKEIWIQSKLELPSANYSITLVDSKSGKPLKCTKSWNIGSFIREDGTVGGLEFCSEMAKFASSNDFKAATKSE